MAVRSNLEHRRTKNDLEAVPDHIMIGWLNWKKPRVARTTPTRLAIDSDLVRGVIEAIVLIPEGGRLRVEVRGELAAILRLSEP